MQLHTACVCDSIGSAWAPREILFWLFKIIQGPREIHADSIEPHTQLVYNPIKYAWISCSKIFMLVPMGMSTACVCDSIGSAWAPSGDFMGAFKNHSCGFYRAGHATSVEFYRNTHGFLVPRHLMPVPMGDHTACVCDYIGSAWAPGKTSAANERNWVKTQ